MVAIALIAFAVVRVVAEPAPPREVRGVLIDLRASSLIYAESATLRDADGVEYTFRVDPQVSTNREEPQSAGHLRQHMALAEPMIVRFRTSADGGLVAIRILDAE